MTGALTSIFISYQAYRKSIPKSAPERPSLVLDAIRDGTPLYYFGVGSNLSRSYLENRFPGKKIDILSMEPCVIPGYRLAFNLRASPPLEPAMGGLEPCESSEDGSVTKPLKAYEKAECHGSLVKLSPEDYYLVYKSEGGGAGVQQGYEEIVVTCIPYDTSKPSVQAVAFRVRDHSRMSQDGRPSKRYMTILQTGAKELGLKPCYQKWLEEHPIQKPCSKIMKKLAVNNMFFNFSTIILFKSRFPIFIQKKLLWVVYGSVAESKWMEVLQEVTGCAILFPTAACGFILRKLLEATGKTPPMLKGFISKMES
eukprot:CAMPEP_0184863610 /NCGR_PEP_ID=MMETSP0580-20130426/11871_1 /TAXON_ID=1118495 /ORGANISM="Dactyliosolen fragilissimus" /LENGTH=310 /DNA_ID=CAMNT_0027362049 /DNA_START=170 /DNA_END=1102 /DNA_ORIENTATION=-